MAKGILLYLGSTTEYSANGLIIAMPFMEGLMKLEDWIQSSNEESD